MSAASGALSSGSVAPVNDLTISVRPTGASTVESPGLSESLSSAIYDKVSQLDTELKSNMRFDAGGFDAAKAAQMPASDLLSPAARPAGMQTNAPSEGITMLNKAFDHAIFMASVNQVLTGVSDTSRTLIRQT
jgi:hypothetical protein